MSRTEAQGSGDYLIEMRDTTTGAVIERRRFPTAEQAWAWRRGYEAQHPDQIGGSFFLPLADVAK